MKTPDPAGGSSAALLRRLNTRTVLDAMWAGRPATASDLMRRTGLTRATVLAVCRELTEQGWLRPARDTRAAGAASRARAAAASVSAFPPIMTTLAPERARAWLTRRPYPWSAPVTAITRPLRAVGVKGRVIWAKSKG